MQIDELNCNFNDWGPVAGSWNNDMALSVECITAKDAVSVYENAACAAFSNPPPLFATFRTSRWREVPLRPGPLSPRGAEGGPWPNADCAKTRLNRFRGRQVSFPERAQGS